MTATTGGAPLRVGPPVVVVVVVVLVPEPGLEMRDVAQRVEGDIQPVWKSNIKRPMPLTRHGPCDRVCSMVWRFYVIDATLSPERRQLDGVEVHKGLRNNLTHWLISTQHPT